MQPTRGGRDAAVLNFAGAFVSIAVAATDREGRSSTRRRSRSSIVMAGLIGAITWNLITWFVGLPVQLEPRPDRRRGRRGHCGRGADASSGADSKDKVLIPSLIAPVPGCRDRHRADRVITRFVARRPPGCTGLPARPARLGRVRRVHAWHERRPEDDGHHHARPDRVRAPRPRTRPPAWVIVAPRSRWPRAPTSAGGGSSARSASASRRSTRPRGSPPRPALRVDPRRPAHFGFPVSTTHVISRLA